MTLEYFRLCLPPAIYDLIKIGENILESLGNNFMNLPPYVFDVDHVAKIRSELSITVLEKKKCIKLPLKKVT